MLAELRDRIAEERDEAAGDRAFLIEALRRAEAAREAQEEERFQAGRDRAAAEVDRERAAKDRTAAAHDRQMRPRTGRRQQRIARSATTSNEALFRRSPSGNSRLRCEPFPAPVTVSRPRFVAAAAMSAVAAVTGRQVLRRQAAIARRMIGKPFGEEAHPADRLYKKKYGAPVELLLLGDSIAAGLGAEKAKHTLGAQLAKRLAKRSRRSVRLRSAARVGSETSALAQQIESLPPGYVADVAVIVVGGNDVIHRVKLAESARLLGDAVTALRDHGTEVVVATCPDLGALRPVPQPLRALARRASRQLASAQRDVVTRRGARAVSLDAVVGPFFIAQPDQMFSLDRFHPSPAGYRRTAKAVLPSVLAALRLEQDVPFGHHPPTAVS